VSVVLAGCGARSPLLEGMSSEDGAAAPVPCAVDSDCFFGDLCQPQLCISGFCQPGTPVSCDDGDPCTADECYPPTGECVFPPLVSDLDGDGHFSPRPGFAPGEPGACGDDCDDTSAEAFPGGIERCDGVDNDCNGVIDDGARYEPTDEPVVRVSSSDHELADIGGLAYTGQHYGATYGGVVERVRYFFQGLAPDGATVVGQTPITNVGNDSYAGPLVWTGAVFGTAWPDRRDNNYEIYFNQLDSQGQKMGADLRLTHADDFSLHPHLLFNGAQFVVVWDDRRDSGRRFRVYGQRVSADGALLGDNVALTELDWEAESPMLAEGAHSLGLAFKMEEQDVPRVGFRVISPDLSEVGPLMLVSDFHSVDARVVWSRDRYVVVWGKYDGGPGDAIWGAAISEDGEVLVPERRLTYGAPFARSKSLLPLGDRLLLVWAAWSPENNYELYSKMLSLDLEEQTPRQRITNDPAESWEPVAAFGPAGDVGILFQDNRDGSPQVYFTRLRCVTDS
jgi:hypothetical protein